ncbi:MAG TPA: hypothetical protein ENI39_05630 [Anaerolineae bacterium]|nr:hypothetical protein [Anaerolineae bacterium]
MRFYLPQTIVSPLTMIRRKRLLPSPGEILVREGERVDPIQVIGHAYLPGGFRIINVAQSLEVPAHVVRRYLKVKTGHEVKRGQVLAARGGPGRRTCRSPTDGRVTGSGSGRLLIEAPPQKVEVRAGYYGTVARVIPRRGVVIQAPGALIQGAWGNNQEGVGVLRTMVKTRDEVLRGRTIDASCRGVVLVGGSHLDQAALERAMELQARGIIVGGIPPELLEKTEGLPFPVVATEGIGTIPISAHIFRLLATHDGREVILNGHFQSRWQTLRPEIIIPLPAEPGTNRLQFRGAPLQVGDRVRAVRTPHVGMTGTVLDLPSLAMRTSTGARLPTARVQPEDDSEEIEPLLIPVVNLEVLR